MVTCVIFSNGWLYVSLCIKFTQSIKAAIYGRYGVTADPSSHSALDGEDKLCMKGMYSYRCVSMHLCILLNRWYMLVGSYIASYIAES